MTQATRFRWAVALGAIVLTLSACAGDRPDGASPSPPVATSPGSPDLTVDPTGAPTEPAVTAARVEVLDAGAEPRVMLHLAPEPGAEAILQLRTELTSEVIVDGEPEPATTEPTTILTVRAVIDDVTDDTIRIQVTYLDVEGDDPDVVRELRDAMVDRSGIVTTTRFGAFLDAQFPLPSDDPTLASLLSSFDDELAVLTVPLPNAEVGVGAQWRVTTEQDLLGTTAEQTSTYVLTAFDDGTWEVDLTVSRRLIPAELPDDDTTTSGQATGSGMASGRVDHPFGAEATVDTDGQIVTEFGPSDDRRMVEDRFTVRWTITTVG